MPDMTAPSTFSPANSRAKTQSIPFSRGLRAHPGRTSAGRSPMAHTQMRLPGSTGMPKCSTFPPAATMPAGPTSRRSTTALAPATRRMSAPSAISARRASATSASAWGQVRGGNSVPVSPATRAAVADAVPSRMPCFNPGSVVITKPTRNGRNGWSRSGGRSCAAASARCSAASGTAKGITLMVATISRAAAGAESGKVPTVSPSSTALTRSSAARSTSSRPGTSASRLTRPVPGLDADSPAASTASARRRAASSSPTSSFSSWAAITPGSPSAARAATAPASRTDPFRRTHPERRRVWARMAPSASSSGTHPNFTAVRAGPRRPGPGWTERSPAR